MANHFFQFKQFRVEQQEAGMKVCTDACAFGAWVNGAIKKLPIVQVIDLGTGTGLLSLMLAQENPCCIDAVELEEGSFKQAGENFRNSPWPNRLNVHYADAIKWNPPRKAHLVICNPPFFKNDLLPAEALKRQTKHEQSLSLQILFSLSELWLEGDGRVALLMPFHRMMEAWKVAAEAGFFLEKSAILKRKEEDAGFRGMMIFSKQETFTSPPEYLIIKGKEGTYTPSFTKLMKPYYL